MNKTTLQEVLQFIRINSTIDERTSIARALNDARERDNKTVGRALRVGSPVQFANKYGILIMGTVKKINPKSIHIKETSTGINWRVTPALVKLQEKSDTTAV
jgi:hypothetical protein